MSKNDSIIQEINEKSSAALAEIEERDYRPFNVSDVDLDNNDLSHSGVLFDADAKKSFLDILRVKSDFPELGESIDRDRWNAAFKVIKETRGTQQLYALYGKEANGDNAIQAIFQKKPNQDNTIRHRSIFTSIARALSETDRQYELGAFAFDPKHDAFDITLKEPRPIDVDRGDIWNGGSRFVFSEMSFSHLPFYERLVCSNGMSTQQHGYRSKVDQRKHSVIKVGDVIMRALTDGHGQLEQVLLHAVQHLKGNNASVLEFETMKRNIKRIVGDNEELYESIRSRYFDDTHITQSYGVNLEDQTMKWKGTADSGINAYNLFNLATWIASHQKITGLDRKTSLDVQIMASNFLFKNPLDLEDVARPLNKIERRLIPEMN